MRGKDPTFEDEYFRKKPRKGTGEWIIVNSPSIFVPVADSHAHLEMLPDPGLALARAAVHKVGFIEAMVDPSTDATATFENLADWKLRGEVLMRHMSTRICGQGHNSLPKVRIAVGVHPHEARLYDDAMEQLLVEMLHDPRVSAVGEIGLDYHYDYSPRQVQKDVFRKQVRIAKEAGLPAVLHIREAYDDAYEILCDEGWPQAGTLLHCYTADAEEVKRWVEAGCYIAFGGAFTFKNSDELRRAVLEVPLDRLLLETDSPYMAPVPFRGSDCEPAHVIFTAERMYNYLFNDDEETASVIFTEESDLKRREFFTRTLENALALLDRPPTPWQLGAA